MTIQNLNICFGNQVSICSTYDSLLIHVHVYSVFCCIMDCRLIVKQISKWVQHEVIPTSTCKLWKSEWLFSANSAIFQHYHGENKLIFNEMMMRSALYLTNTQWPYVEIYSVSSLKRQLKQQFADRHVAPLRHIIMILNQPVFALFFWLLHAQQRSNKYQFYSLLFVQIRTWTHDISVCNLGEHSNHYTTELAKQLGVKEQLLSCK